MENALLSAVGQRHDNFRPHILIIDDASTDHTASVLSSFAAKYASTHDIEVIQNTHNIGTLMVRKIAIEHSKDYLLFVDGDDYLQGDTVVEDCLALLQKSGTDFVWFPMIL